MTARALLMAIISSLLVATVFVTPAFADDDDDDDDENPPTTTSTSTSTSTTTSSTTSTTTSTSTTTTTIASTTTSKPSTTTTAPRKKEKAPTTTAPAVITTTTTTVPETTTTSTPAVEEEANAPPVADWGGPSWPSPPSAEPTEATTKDGLVIGFGTEPNGGVPREGADTGTGHIDPRLDLSVAIRVGAAALQDQILVAIILGAVVAALSVAGVDRVWARRHHEPRRG